MGMEYNGISTLCVQKSSITDLQVDCIVNAANRYLQHGSGVCGAIFQAAGAAQLQAACNAIGICEVGHTVVTPGFQLKAKYIIHAVGPKWVDGNHGEAGLLKRCYQSAMQKAQRHNCHSIAFPLISAGVYGYPVKQAWEVAIQAVRSYQQANSHYKLDATFAVISDDMLQLGNAVLSGVQLPQNTVFFWKPQEANGVLSQFHPAQFVVEGIHYDHTEQYMMAKKALLAHDLHSYVAILHQQDPYVCQKLGRGVKNLDVKRWDAWKLDVVYNANLAKFRQNPYFQKMLLDTGSSLLVLADPGDVLWGIGLTREDPRSADPAQWRGKNLLGKVLLQVREVLQK